MTRGESRYSMRVLNVFLNLTATAALIAMGVATFIRPQWLPSLHLSPLDAQLVVMQLLSFLMLLACMQKNVSRGWRIFTLAGSFVILAESILMSGLLFIS